MKDCLGKEVNVGDEVVYVGYHRDLHHGKISHVFNQTVQSDYFIRESQEIFKVENKQAILDEVYQWIEDNAFQYVITKGIGIDIYMKFDSERMIADLKKAIEEKL